ncbi:NfeD family protein [Marivirga arenosa]|jgi:membrane-bound serine protease (ClpP class)|uniref:NfeD family protein n=1 Tax=Marivirga arenosa TaxID=3059076 RepID=A0AA49GD59_9BACT|nr:MULTISPECIES: NfeD family protein [unclassified Marivirga]WKK79459.2 NfeD family protein [Marivirga sp. BKB1-2]WMN06184.1 NfeD family protein [Marivirga sp. ABR2-2]
MKRSTLILLFCSFVTFSSLADTLSLKNEVFIMEIKDQIDARTKRYVDLALAEAKSRNSSHIIIEMNTYGGALYDADEIRSALLNLEIPVYVFIDNNAASAGALISIACDSIYMAPGGSIGAATVVNQTGEAAPDKYQSYMRSIMRSTAEASGRNPQIAEAMVDENIEIDSISPAGEVITFSTSEAIKYDFCEGEFNSTDALLNHLNLNDYQIYRFEVSNTEAIISFFINPFISGILILIIIGGIYFELQTPGVGFPIIASIIALVLYLIPYYLNGLAENWEILAFIIGLILIAVEVFVIPGFGIFGILGLIITLGSLVFMMLNNENFDFQFVPAENITRALLTTLTGLLGSIVLMFIGGIRLTNSKFFKKIALQGVQSKTEGYSSRFIQSGLIDKEGTVFSVLRPSGKVDIEGELYDAYTRGEYLEQGEKIIVIEESGTSLKVKKAEN